MQRPLLFLALILGCAALSATADAAAAGGRGRVAVIRGMVIVAPPPLTSLSRVEVTGAGAANFKRPLPLVSVIGSTRPGSAPVEAAAALPACVETTAGVVLRRSTGCAPAQ